MNMTETKTAEYVYVIYGVIPELMPCVAYRCVGKQKVFRLKAIKCPYCGELLIEIARHTIVDLYRLPTRKPVKCHMVRQCEMCSGEVGMYMK